jgi:serine/threonine protein kinase
MIFRTTFSTYETSEIAGEGGSSRIFKAVSADGIPVAIKLLNVNKVNKESLKRFKNEIYFCLRNEHPNIVTVIDHGLFTDKAGNSIPFYVMPLYSCSLRDLIKTGIATNKVLPYFSQILNGIEAAHLKKVIHRDIKPENILFDEKQNLLLIADFGIAQFQEEELYTTVDTKDTTRLANFQYAAPEQRDRGQVVDHRADIYAIGLIMNEMFTGQVPYGTEYKTIAAVSPNYPYLDELVSTMLRRSPAERPASIEAIKRELIKGENKFIISQKISQLKDIVIPTNNVDDPIVADPIRIIDADWDKGILTLILNRPVNEKWIYSLQNMGSHTSLWGKGPEAFGFRGSKAIISANENQVQDIINYFKQWLSNVKIVYENTLRRELREIEERKRREIEEEKKIQEARERVLKNIKL